MESVPYMQFNFIITSPPDGLDASAATDDDDDDDCSTTNNPPETSYRGGAPFRMPPCFLLWIRGGGGLGELPPIAHTSEMIKFLDEIQNL